MRTPVQTLERLAEVAPKEWHAKVGHKFFFMRGRIVNPLHDDIENGSFCAWCKKQLLKAGWCIETVSVPKGTTVATIRRAEDIELRDTKNILKAVATTEWQAVAEVLIIKSERDNEY